MPGQQGRHKSTQEQGSLMSHHRHTRTSCRKALPNLPKAAHLCKAEVSASHGLAYTSHHHTHSVPARLQGLTSNAHCLRQRPLQQAKSYCFGEDIQTEPRCIPPSQKTTIKKKMLFSSWADFGFNQGTAGSLHPKAKLCSLPCITLHRGICGWWLQCLSGSS